MADRAHHRMHAGLGMLLAASLMLAACYEEEDATLPATIESVAPKKNTRDWLEPSSNEDPLAFLMRLSGEDAQDLAPGLERASGRYREGPRMIANRIVQLWQGLGADGEDPVPIARLLDEFSRIEPAPEKSIGAIIQQYRVLRDQGLTHQAAMAALTGAEDG